MRSDDRRIRHPAAFVIGWFGALIALGTILLALPLSHSKPDDVGVGDALFTAASAVTVTGLGVVDTGEAWSAFGETIVLLLIQVGGLGIMTLASFLGIAINRRLRVRSGLLAGAEIGLSDYGVLRHLIRDLVVFVALTESVVSVLLTVRFALRGEYSWLGSLHQGVFHSISAFNNAGFSISEGGWSGTSETGMSHSLSPPRSSSVGSAFRWCSRFATSGATRPRGRCTRRSHCP